MGREGEAMRPGTPGSPGMGDREPGTAEVHSGLHSGGGSDAYSGLGFASAGTMGEAANRVRDAGTDVRGEGAGNLRARARHLAEDVGHRASDAASIARERVSGLRERANRALERRGVVERLRENPLPMLGVAFAVGFLLAGAEDRNANTRAARARRELRSALVAGLSAGIAQGARSFLSEAGSEGSGFLSSLLDNLAGEGDRARPRDEFGGGRGSEGAPYARGGGARSRGEDRF